MSHGFCIYCMILCSIFYSFTKTRPFDRCLKSVSGNLDKKSSKEFPIFSGMHFYHIRNGMI